MDPRMGDMWEGGGVEGEEQAFGEEGVWCLWDMGGG